MNINVFLFPDDFEFIKYIEYRFTILNIFEIVIYNVKNDIYVGIHVY